MFNDELFLIDIKTAKLNRGALKEFKRTLLEWVACVLAEEFWDFLGGEGTYSLLLDCFEKVGVELRPEIDEYFNKYI